MPKILDSPGVPLNPVAFTAHAYSKTYSTSGETITFDDVTTNIGDAFDAPTGVFTCPVTGVYVFHFSVTSSESLGFTADLERESAYLVTIEAEEQRQRHSPNMATTMCSAGA